MDYSALAKQFGGGVVQQQPQPQQQPDWMAGLSPKDQAELQMKMHAEARKRIAELDTEIAKGGEVSRDLQRFGQLNREEPTGSVWDNVAPDWKFLHSDNVNEMRSIQNRLGPSQREPGSGASSDRDVSLFLSGLPSVEQKGNVNRNIRSEYEKRMDYAVSKKKAMEDYLYQKGNLTGFDTYWQQMEAQGKQSPKLAPMKANQPAKSKPARRAKFLGFE